MWSFGKHIINLIRRIPVTFMLELCVKLNTILSGFLKVTLVVRIFDTFLFWHYVKLKTFLSWLPNIYTVKIKTVLSGYMKVKSKNVWQINIFKKYILSWWWKSSNQYLFPMLHQCHADLLWYWNLITMSAKETIFILTIFHLLWDL